ncbi:cupin domain-containing protein [Nocardia arthritidis]|uniref:Cupin domain-containing protein n=1 Tax=Nocardia arthritidis TaxID=228602 RepID=A0A6G9YLH5_9NOCA|nr:cupin domain-containing protein [Nocardia arthritidis]
MSPNIRTARSRSSSGYFLLDTTPSFPRDEVSGLTGVAQPVITHVALTKTVAKHWGEERWLVTEGAPFGFKVIHLTAGHRTSLQYHRRKEEANLILRGSGTLYYAPSPDEPLLQRPLVVGEIVHVRPGTVHRIEADTDITLVEVSTPELDDVIRLADDQNRADGRIDAEHETGSAS